MTFIMCQPNCVFTGSDRTFFSSRNAAFSNSGTVTPFFIQPRSPPFFADGQVDFCFATSSNVLSVLFISYLADHASSSFLTRM